MRLSVSLLVPDDADASRIKKPESADAAGLYSIFALLAHDENKRNKINKTPVLIIILFI